MFTAKSVARSRPGRDRKARLQGQACDISQRLSARACWNELRRHDGAGCRNTAPASGRDQRRSKPDSVLLVKAAMRLPAMNNVIRPIEHRTLFETGEPQCQNRAFDDDSKGVAR